MLLQDAPIKIDDVLFRVTDVIQIIGGICTLLAVYFYLKYKVERQGEVLDAHMKTDLEEHARIHVRIDDTKDDHTDLEKELSRKHDDLKGYIQQMEVRIIEKISEIKNK